MKEKLIITDTNVFFDLINIEALSYFFGLDLEICTTDFVVNEITRPDQHEKIQAFVQANKLTVFTFSSDEMSAVSVMVTKRNLRRIADRSVLWKALELKCKLLSGDSNLRKEAEENGLTVKGSIWVLQQLAINNIVTRPQAVSFLQKLKKINDRLPEDVIDNLIKEFST